MSPADLLVRASLTFRQKNAIYGNNVYNVGEAMVGLFPKGVTLKTAKDWNRMHIFLLKVVKLSRYAVQWENGHQDSIHDDMVYSAILEALDEEIQNERRNNRL